MAEVVYTSLAGGNGAQGKLFQGRKFWLSRKVPQRSRFIAEITANGGEVLSSETQADVLLVDHARKEALPGTYSYRFIEESIRNGTLERLSDHAVGPPIGTIRAVGSSTHPAKTGRQKFTEDDDRFLLKWVRSSLRKGARTQGNEIYKQLEEENPRHPWQAWRDRWVKHLRDICPTATSDESSSHSPSDNLEGSEVSEMNDAREGRKAKTKTEFSKKDMKVLLDHAEHILEIPSQNMANAWRAWAQDYDVQGRTVQGRTAEEWQYFWEETVLPIYLRRADTNQNSSTDSKSNEPPLTQKQTSKSPKVQSAVGGITNAHPVVKREPQSPSVQSHAVGTSKPLKVQSAVGGKTNAHPVVKREPQSPSVQSHAVGTSKSPKVQPAVGGKTNAHPVVKREPQSPSVQSHTVSTPKAHPVVSSEPQSPATPLASKPSSSSSRRNGVSKAVGVEEPEPDRPESQERFYPAVETPTDTNLSLKRKRAASEDNSPRSSPPYVEASEKRQRRHKSSMPAEIAPTPEQSPIHNHDFSSSVFESQSAQRLNGSSYEVIVDEDGDGHDERWEHEGETERLDLNGYGSESSDEDGIQEDEKILGRQASPVLPEPNHKTNKTQSSSLDLHVVPRGNGWDESLGGSPESSPSPPALTYQAPVYLDSKNDGIVTIEETQTLLADLSVPAPDGGWDILESLSSSHDPNFPPPASPTQSEIPGLLDAWIDEHVTSGFSSEDVISALEHSSLDKELAERVLEHMKRNQGDIPTDTAGVWTESDDEGFQSTDAQRHRELEQKHGSENIEKRWNFLNEFIECRRLAQGGLT